MKSPGGVGCNRGGSQAGRCLDGGWLKKESKNGCRMLTKMGLGGRKWGEVGRGGERYSR